MSDPRHLCAITRVGTVIVPVTDQAEALQFYTGTLGFEIRLDAEFRPGDRWIEVAPPGAETTIALVPIREGETNAVTVSFATGDAGADHATLRATDLDVDADVLDFGPSVPPMFTFRDRDGNHFRVVERP